MVKNEVIIRKILENLFPENLLTLIIWSPVKKAFDSRPSVPEINKLISAKSFQAKD